MSRVLVIDDDTGIRRLLRVGLSAKDFEVFEAATAFEGLQALSQARPDIVLLDLNLPDQDGSQVLAAIRAFSRVPVIILSVRNAESDIVDLLNAGADDYLTKPFNSGELLARLGVALRHQRPEPQASQFRTGNLVIDFEAHTVQLAAKEIRLTPTEYSLLALLARHPGKLLTHQLILGELWGPIGEAEAGSLRVHIASLRKKIEVDTRQPRYLITEPGIGYRLMIFG